MTSVRLDITRSLLAGILFALIGLPCLLAPGSNSGGIGAVFLALAILFLWGSPTVVVNTAGQDKNASRGWPWQRAAASDFVEAIRQRLVEH